MKLAGQRTGGIMSQAEIAGGQVTGANELPGKGRRLRDFSLRSTVGGEVKLSDYNGRRNLVLIFLDNQPRTLELLSEMAKRYGEFKNWEAEVIAVAQAPCQAAIEINNRPNLPCPVLVDEAGRIHNEVGASDVQGRAAAAIYITDRFGEVFAVYRTAEGEALPKVDDILNWLEFINSQCPECEPPEWPL